VKIVQAVWAITTGLVIAACGSDGGDSGSTSLQDGGVGNDAGDGASGGVTGRGGAIGRGGATGISWISTLGGAGSGGGTCAALLACCNKTLDAQFKQACLSSYDQAKPSGDAICGSLLSTFKQAYCP
jgi:hypothetical protein